MTHINDSYRSDIETTRAEIEASLARISRSYISNLRQLRNHYDPENENRPKSEPNRTTKFIPIQPLSHLPQNHVTSTSGHMIATNNHVTNHKVPVGNHGNYIHANFNTEEYENGALLRFEHDVRFLSLPRDFSHRIFKKSIVE